MSICDDRIESFVASRIRILSRSCKPILSCSALLEHPPSRNLLDTNPRSARVSVSPSTMDLSGLVTKGLPRDRLPGALLLLGFEYADGRSPCTTGHYWIPEVTTNAGFGRGKSLLLRGTDGTFDPEASAWGSSCTNNFTCSRVFGPLRGDPPVPCRLAGGLKTSTSHRLLTRNVTTPPSGIDPHLLLHLTQQTCRVRDHELTAEARSQAPALSCSVA